MVSHVVGVELLRWLRWDRPPSFYLNNCGRRLFPSHWVWESDIVIVYRGMEPIDIIQNCYFCQRRGIDSFLTPCYSTYLLCVSRESLEQPNEVNRKCEFPPSFRSEVIATIVVQVGTLPNTSFIWWLGYNATLICACTSDHIQPIVPVLDIPPP